MILALTSAEFQTVALGWLAAVAAVAAVAVPLYFKIAAQIEENQKRLDKHDEIQGVNTKAAPAPSVPDNALHP